MAAPNTANTSIVFNVVYDDEKGNTIFTFSNGEKVVMPANQPMYKFTEGLIKKQNEEKLAAEKLAADRSVAENWVQRDSHLYEQRARTNAMNSANAVFQYHYDLKRAEKNSKKFSKTYATKFYYAEYNRQMSIHYQEYNDIISSRMKSMGF
jgi:hypothetical protein